MNHWGARDDECAGENIRRGRPLPEKTFTVVAPPTLGTQYSTIDKRWVYKVDGSYSAFATLLTGDG